MKKLDKYSRLAGYLEKLFDKLNADFFDGQLERPVITIQSTPRAYGHYSLYDAWNCNGEGRRELNIGAGTLDRPIENIISTLLHEMVHMLNDTILNIQDCSRGGTYHNKYFKKAAEEHGLVVTRSDKYGWSTTAPSEMLLDWILENDIKDILINRNEYGGIRIAGGNNTANGGEIPRGTTKGNSRRYICPCCGTIIRATRTVNVICGDCMETMQEG